MCAAEIVIHEVEADRVGVIFCLFEKAFVRRVKRRIPILIVRFARSTGDVDTLSMSGSPMRQDFFRPVQ